MKTKIITSILFVGLFLFMFFPSAIAQLNYQTGGFSTAASTYTDLGTNGSVVTMNNIDNGFSTPISIGFTFRFNGTDYDSLVMYVDGFVKLGSDTASSNLLYTTFTQPPSAGPFSSTVGRDSNLIAPFGQDLWNRGGAQASEFRIHTSGFAGSRICTIQWKNVSDKVQNGVDSQYDTINFQLKLYETSNWIEFVYGRWVPSTNPSNARFGAVGLKGSSSLNAQLITITKASAIAWSNVIVNAGNYTTNALNYGNNVGIGRPAPDIGRIYRFTPVVFNDLAVSNVYAVGKLITNSSLTDSIRAYIINPGVNTQTSVTVSLTITGANSFSATANIASLAPNAGVYVSFPPFTPTNNGTSLITVSVPTDDNASNNVGTYGLSASNSFLSYNDTLQSPGQSYGHSTWVPFWGTRFRITDKRRITEVRSFIFSNSGAVGDTIRGMILDTNGIVIGVSAPFVIQPSNLGTWVTLPILIPIEVNNRSFLSGIACQSASVNRFLGSIQNETPIRPNNTAFYQINNFSTPVSAFTTGMNFGFPTIFGLGRLMMECTAELTPANDYGVVAAFPQNNQTVPTGVNIPLRALVRNLGTATQSSGIAIRYRVNNGTIVGPVNTGVSLNEGDTTLVTFSGLSSLNFSSPGTYTIKIWSQLSNDPARYNDTFTFTINAVNSGLNMPYRTSDLITNNNWMIQSNMNNIIIPQTVVNPNGTTYAGTLLFNNFNVFGTGMLLSPMLNFNGLNNPVLHFHVAHAPSTISGISDTLDIIVSTDGGYTFTTLYSKTGQGPTPRLGTIAAQGTFYSPSSANDWRQEFVDLSAFANQPQVIIAIRNKSATGNNVYLTNINVTNPSAVNSNPVFSTGTISSGAITINLLNMGGANGEMSISSNNIFPVSVAPGYSLPVFAANGSATTNTAAVFTPTNVSNRFWTVNYSGVGTGNLPSSVGYQVIIDYATVPGVTNGDSVYIMRRSDHTSSWVALPTSRSVTALSTATINGFGEFALGSLPTVNSLPVELLAFKGVRNKNDILLTWNTTSEINNDYFQVERLNANGEFENIGAVKGAGNSNNSIFYQFNDVQQPNQVCYHLKQVDFDGTAEYSNIICINGNTINPVISPNPFNDQIQIQLAEIGNAEISVYDLQGKKLASETYQSGNSILLLQHLQSIPKGIYMIEVKTDYQTMTQKIVKTQ